MTKEAASEIKELLSRGVGSFIDPDGVFEKKLRETPKKVVIKFGVDPTRPDIHLGHAVVFRKLRKFQDLGCKVVFLIGDITAQIGDPTGKSKIRPEISQKEIEENMKTFLDQVGKILKTEGDVFSWIRNSDWFVSVNDVEAPENVTVSGEINGKEFSLPSLPGNNFLVKAFVWEKSRMQKGRVTSYSLINVLSILRGVTFNRLIDRDMFQERIKNGGELYMHEMMYPILQGIDSSALTSIYGSCDLEVGGTDQTFNMLMGRDIMKMNKQEPQAVLAFELLEGLDGKEKMSKSLNNYIAITDSPNDMFGKIMSIPDSSILRYFSLSTYTPISDIEEIKKDLEKGKNPKEIKMRLALEIVEIYHGKVKAQEAEKAFDSTFSKGNIPEDAPSAATKKGALLQEVLRENGIVSSNSEFRRLVDSGAISTMETKFTIRTPDFTVDESMTIRVGKNRFLKIIAE